MYQPHMLNMENENKKTYKKAKTLASNSIENKMPSQY